MFTHVVLNAPRDSRLTTAYPNSQNCSQQLQVGLASRVPILNLVCIGCINFLKGVCTCLCEVLISKSRLKVQNKKSPKSFQIQDQENWQPFKGRYYVSHFVLTLYNFALDSKYIHVHLNNQPQCHFCSIYRFYQFQTYLFGQAKNLSIEK